MGFDLTFYSKEEIDRNQIFKYLKSLGIFTLSDEKFKKNCQFWYENPDTDTHFSFDLSKEESDKELIEMVSKEEKLNFKGFFNTGLSFNINFNRHSFFKDEVFPIVDKLIKKFNLYVVDFQNRDKLEPKKYSLVQLKKSWGLSNAGAIKTLLEDGAIGKPDSHDGIPMKRKNIEYLWKWQFERNRMQNKVAEDSGVEFVPSIFLFRHKETKRIITLFTWVPTIHSYFPMADNISVVFKLKSGILSKKDVSMIFKWNEVFNLLKNKMRYVNNGIKYYIFHPENYEENLIEKVQKLSHSELHKEWERITLGQVIDEEYIK